MPDIFYLVSKWWKSMLIVVLLCILGSTIVVFLKPSLYLSVATALPANSISADKARIFNNNIESLYPVMGLPDDLDRIIGTAQLDTVYLTVVDQYNLVDRYKIAAEKEKARLKAAHYLKKCSRVIKSDYGELKVKVWDQDKDAAAQLANAIMDKLDAIHRYLQSSSNMESYKTLRSSQQKIQAEIDSLDKQNLHENEMALPGARRKVLFDQWQENEKLISEYQLILENDPPVLMIVEKAKPGIRPDKPERLQIIIATTLLSLIFAFLAALIIEKSKKTS